MDKSEIIRGNQGFFCVAVGLTICNKDFPSAVLQSLSDEQVQYGIEMENYSGYILIDSTEIIREFSQRSFADEVQNGILRTLSYELTSRICGELADEAEVAIRGYKFKFKISRYERDMDHVFEVIDNPSRLPNGERIGRFVDLKITFAA